MKPKTPRKRRTHSKATLVAFQVPTELVVMSFWYALLAKPSQLSVTLGALGTVLEQLSAIPSSTSNFYAVGLFAIFALLLLGCFQRL
ncbi:MAG: hypothetical protein WB643_14505 [Candidatus Bathyarchaeia archaeon]